MDNLAFIDENDISMVQDEDGQYDTSNTSRVDETSFTVPDATEATSMVHLKQKVNRDKIIALYRHLSVTGNTDLIDLERFRLTKNKKKGVTIV